LDDEILSEFKHKEKDLFKIWYKLDKSFKNRSSGKYPTMALRTPYQYIVAMLCRLYGKGYDSTFTLSLMPLIEDYLGYKILMELTQLTIVGIYLHRYSDRSSLLDLRDLSRDDQSPKI
jgi:hypothetical protein